MTSAVSSPAAPDKHELRHIMGHYATGASIVTAMWEGEPHGLAVNSLTSVSLDPPLVAFCPARASFTWARMRRTGWFGVNVLGRRHERFATRATPAGADRFAGLHWEPGPGGVPLLADALAALACEIVAVHPAGDHWIVVGRVEEIRVAPAEDPLVFFAGAFR
jgi:3-hydroxy-9,10-secoandrosta-1,3,5(10)-triene-9,17-dione monooxygenase reductase component